MKKSVRRDFITRTLIILCEKYDLNNNPKFITFEEFKKELEFTISIMTDKYYCYWWNSKFNYFTRKWRKK